MEKMYRIILASCMLSLSTACSGKPVEKTFTLTEGQREACLLNSKDCVFPVNYSEAKDIAISKGFSLGVKPWEINLYWHDDYGYVWVIKNTLSIKGLRREGKIMQLDAYTGNKARVSNWEATYDARLR